MYSFLIQCMLINLFSHSLRAVLYDGLSGLHRYHYLSWFLFVAPYRIYDGEKILFVSTGWFFETD